MYFLQEFIVVYQFYTLIFRLKFSYTFKMKLHMSWDFTNLQFWLIWISFRLGTGITVMSIKLRCQRGRDFLFALSRIIFINIHKWGAICMTVWGSLIDCHNVKWINTLSNAKRYTVLCYLEIIFWLYWANNIIY